MRDDQAIHVRSIELQGLREVDRVAIRERQASQSGGERPSIACWCGIQDCLPK
jgi:hypothetical protein